MLQSRRWCNLKDTLFLCYKNENVTLDTECILWKRQVIDPMQIGKCSLGYLKGKIVDS